MQVSIIIVSYNTQSLLRDCLASVREKTRGVDCEIFVVDNASSDGSAEMVAQEFPAVHLIRNDDNRGFAKANNQAIRLARGAYIVLLNSDTVLENDAIGLMHAFMESHPRAGICGPLLHNADGSVQRSIDKHNTLALFVLRNILGSTYNRLPRLLGGKYHPCKFNHTTTQPIADGWLTGAVLMVRKAAIDDAGLLDEAYFFYGEDADWGLALSRANWQTWFVAEAMVTHLHGRSRRQISLEEETALKIRCVQQQHYYVRKNLGRFRAGAFRVTMALALLANLIRRSLQAAFAVGARRPEAIAKRRAAAKIYRACTAKGGFLSEFASHASEDTSGFAQSTRLDSPSAQPVAQNESVK